MWSQLSHLNRFGIEINLGSHRRSSSRRPSHCKYSLRETFSPSGKHLGLNVVSNTGGDRLADTPLDGRKRQLGTHQNMTHFVDLFYAVSGFGVGFLVGITGIGGGSLMTPLLILVFGVHPATAVGTDLLYAAATKTGGTVVHGLNRNIDWRVVGWLATGSVPMTAATLFALWRMGLHSGAVQNVMTGLLSSALIATSVVLIFRKRILALYSVRIDERARCRTVGLTILVGAVLGLLVTISSVGAGALGATALMILYPRLHTARIVGSDIAHAVPLTLLAGLGHWMVGSVDWALLGALLAGSLPGIVIGSHLSVRVPEAVLRFGLATTLILVAGRLVL
jgi:uncharacterized protein